ncbi:tetratricopeptide repeat protein 23 isoform X2 [Melanotaenia boesemani]|uniref:tetratricopeptide repeat protein 23 isoform X2 n=1 Tax=Melanotaenia boesemani TaxID=1250792 RepID=UPI001C050FEF|nr:tetratricopeptide repeat protein 23 isoform X2 [Melanotaenia boesemani]
MDGGEAMIKTHVHSSESPTEGMDVITDRGSDVLSPPLPGCAKKEFLMMPPEEKLKHFDTRAQTSEDNHEDLVRCLALTRLIYGEKHLKLAQAQARLANAYFQFKGWGLQALEHLVQAKELLPPCSSSPSCRSDKLEALTCLLSVHLTQGGASLLTDNLEEADSSFLKADQILAELHQHNVINQEEKTKTQLEISSGLYSVYKRQNRTEDALSQCEKSLQLLQDCNKPEKTCSVYRDMATIEQDRGHLDQAVEHLSKAHAIAMSHTPEGLEGAQISHSLALILPAAEPHHNDAAGHYFEQSLCAYKQSVGPQDPAFLAAQDDFCRFLLVNGQQEKCVAIQRASLDSKRSAFGDLSSEVADTLQLIGSVEMTEGRMKQAHRTMTKCLKIQSVLYGPQHKKTKTVQKAVEMLARAPEVVDRQHRHSRKEKKMDTFAAVPSGNSEKSTSDS